jgi:hypothetical protein
VTRKILALFCGLATLASFAFACMFILFSRMGVDVPPYEGLRVGIECTAALVWLMSGLIVTFAVYKDNWSRVGKIMLGASALLAVLLAAHMATGLLRYERSEQSEQSPIEAPPSAVAASLAVELPEWARSRAAMEAHGREHNFRHDRLIQGDEQFEELSPARWRGEIGLPRLEYGYVETEAPDMLTDLAAIAVHDGPAGRQTGWLFLGTKPHPAPPQDYTGGFVGEYVVTLSLWFADGDTIVERDLYWRDCRILDDFAVFDVNGEWARLSPVDERPAWINTTQSALGDTYQIAVSSVVGLAMRATEIWSASDEAIWRDPERDHRLSPAHERGFLRATGRVDGDLIEVRWTEWGPEVQFEAVPPACVNEFGSPSADQPFTPIRQELGWLRHQRGDVNLLRLQRQPCWCD